jgi:hypothetical protein
MIVLSDAEGDIDGIASQKRGLLQTLSHMPA